MTLDLLPTHDIAAALGAKKRDGQLLVGFALLFMNLWVPYINDLTRQTPYGYIKPAKKAKEGAGK